jgi:hypothetical protein
MCKCQKFREATKFAFANLHKAAIVLSRCYKQLLLCLYITITIT